MGSRWIGQGCIISLVPLAGCEYGAAFVRLERCGVGGLDRVASSLSSHSSGETPPFALRLHRLHRLRAEDTTFCPAFSLPSAKTPPSACGPSGQLVDDRALSHPAQLLRKSVPRTAVHHCRPPPFLDLPLPFTAFPWPPTALRLAFHRPSLTFHRLRSTFHRPSLTFHRRRSTVAVLKWVVISVIACAAAVVACGQREALLDCVRRT